MAKRIPHKNEIIEDVEQVETYIDNHEKHARSQFTAFLKDFDKLEIKGRLLEIGSGPGFLTAMIAKRNPQVHITAVEPSQEMIGVSRRYLAQKGLDSNVDFVQGSVEDRSFMEKLDEFDLVYSTFSLHHWEKPHLAWRNMMSRVKKEGTLLIHDLKRVPWLYYLPFKGGLFESVRAAYRPVEIDHMLRQMGVRNASIVTPFPYFWMSVQVKNRST